MESYSTFALLVRILLWILVIKIQYQFFVTNFHIHFTEVSKICFWRKKKHIKDFCNGPDLDLQPGCFFTAVFACRNPTADGKTLKQIFTDAQTLKPRDWQKNIWELGRLLLYYNQLGNWEPTCLAPFPFFWPCVGWRPRFGRSRKRSA